MKLFSLLDFKNEMLPKTTGLGGPTIRQPKPVNFVEPSFFVSNHQGIKRNLQRYDTLQPAKLRAESLEKLNGAIDAINTHIESSNRLKGLKFGVHQDSGRYFAVVRDQETGEVLKTIPGETALELASRLQDLSGALVDITG